MHCYVVSQGGEHPGQVLDGSRLRDGGAEFSALQDIDTQRSVSLTPLNQSLYQTGEVREGLNHVNY